MVSHTTASSTIAFISHSHYGKINNKWKGEIIKENVQAREIKTKHLRDVYVKLFAWIYLHGPELSEVTPESYDCDRDHRRKKIRSCFPATRKLPITNDSQPAQQKYRLCSY